MEVKNKGFKGFVILGLMLCLTPLKGQDVSEAIADNITEEVSKEINPIQSVETFNFLGILSVALDSLTRDMFSARLLKLLEHDPDFTLKSWLPEMEKVNNKYQRSLNSFGFLKELLPEFNEPLLFITFEKEKSFFICKVYIVKNLQDEFSPVESIQFVPEIKTHIRQAAGNMHTLIRKHYRLSLPKKNSQTVFKLKKPIIGGILADNDEVVEPDSVKLIKTGQTLIINKEAEPYFIRSQKFRYILYPGSAYTFYSPSLIEIHRGRLGSIQTEFPAKVITGSLICESSSTIASIEFSENKSTLTVFAGSVKARPVNDEKGVQKIEGKQTLKTRGFHPEVSTVTDSIFSEQLQVFKPLLNSRIVGHFKSSRKILDIVPTATIEFFADDVSDPMNYFMASELYELGIPMDALSYEGEAWDREKTLFKPGANETGCYLCSPNRIDLD